MKQRVNLRLSNHDYSRSAYYFFTSRIQDKTHQLSIIVGDEVNLTQYGNIVQDNWQWLHDTYSYLKPMDEFIIMPDHIHGILHLPTQYPIDHAPKSLSSLIGSLKANSSKRIREAGWHRFIWQRSFHDHIVRDNGELERIRKYIINNPRNWCRKRAGGRL